MKSKLRILHLEKQSKQRTPLTKEHKLAMVCLPLDGRWQSEGQMNGQTQLGNRTRRIYRDLVKAGFCERKIVAILCDWSDAKDFMRMYRITWKLRQANWKRLKLTSLECLPAC
jgi:hypothetical protein